MTKRFPPHLSEELLEEYVFRRLPEADAAQVEEHLLICEYCQETVRELDAFVSSMKAAKAEARPPQATSQARNLSAISRMGAWATAALLLLAVGVYRTHPLEDSSPVDVTLSSIRGFNSLPEAPARKPLQLSMEAPDLTTGQKYRIALVDSSGGPVWTGTATYSGRKLLAQVPKRLESGVYWIRLYDSQERQLREFGMSVK